MPPGKAACAVAASLTLAENPSLDGQPVYAGLRLRCLNGTRASLAILIDPGTGIWQSGGDTNASAIGAANGGGEAGIGGGGGGFVLLTHQAVLAKGGGENGVARFALGMNCWSDDTPCNVELLAPMVVGLVGASWGSLVLQV